MEPQAQQQQQPTITTEGLSALYRLVGEYAHAACEAQAQLQQARALLRQALEQYGPKPEDAAPEDAAPEDAPTPIAPMRPRKPAAADTPAAETGA